MTNPKQILLLLSTDQIDKASEAIKEYLKPTFSAALPVSQTDSQCFGNFALECLRRCAEKIKTASREEEIPEILTIVHLCGQSYSRVQAYSNVKDPIYVHKLLFHIVASLREKAAFAEDLIKLVHLEYQLAKEMCTSEPPSSSLHAILQGCFASLWNTTNKLKSTVPLLLVIKLRHASLLLLSISADPELVLCARLKNAITHFMQLLQGKPAGSEAGSTEFSKWMIRDLTEKVRDNRCSDPQLLDTLVLQLGVVRVEHLMELKCYSEALAAASEIRLKSAALEGKKQDLHSAICCACHSAVLVKKLMKKDGRKSEGKQNRLEGNSDTVGKAVHKNGVCSDDSELAADDIDLKKIHQTVIGCASACSKIELSTLHSAYHLLVQQVAVRTSDMPVLTVSVIQKIVDSIEVSLFIAHKLLSDSDSEHPAGVTDVTKIDQFADSLFKRLTVELSDKSKSEVSEKLYLAVLAACNRKLLLLCMKLTHHKDHDFDPTLQTAQTTVTHLDQLLKMKVHGSSSSSKHQQNERFSYVSTCSKLAQLCSKSSRPADGIAFYKATVRQMEQSDQYTVANFVKMFESMAECYKMLKQWSVAMDTIIQALHIAVSLTKTSNEPFLSSGPVSSLISGWVKIKRDAVLNEEVKFASLTLHHCLSKLAVTLPGVQMSDLLQAELLALRKLSRHQYRCEYHVLTELLSVEDLSTIHLAEHLVDMATIVCITGMTFQYRSTTVTPDESGSRSKVAMTTAGSGSALQDPDNDTTGDVYRSALDMVDRAISLLVVDPSVLTSTTSCLATEQPTTLTTGCLATEQPNTLTAGLLALAYYRKFVLKEEMRLQETSSAEGKADVNTVPVEDSTQPVTSSNSKRGPVAPGDSQVDSGKSVTDEMNYSYSMQCEDESIGYVWQALDMWEKVAMSSEGLDTAQVSKHVEELISCVSRLLAMRQPVLALTAAKTAWTLLEARIAHTVTASQSDARLRSQVLTQMVKALLHHGYYREAETMLNSAATSPVREARDEDIGLVLLKAETSFYTGTRQAAVEAVNKSLTSKQLKTRTKSSFLMEGMAKRLLSVFLCLGDSSVSSWSRPNLLDLAGRAALSHLSVINYIDKSAGDGIMLERYEYGLEMLQSMLHVGKLYRLIGDPADARTYLGEGLKFSQAMGLPRWSNDFLLELVRLELMAGDMERAFQHMELLLSLMTNESPGPSHVTAESGSTQIEKQSEKCTGNGKPMSSNMNKPIAEIPNQKDSTSVDLEEMGRLVAKQQAPVCSCGFSKECWDPVRHQLCLETCVVMAEFLSHCSQSKTPVQLLSHVTSLCNGTGAVISSQEGKNGPWSHDSSKLRVNSGLSFKYQPKDCARQGNGSVFDSLACRYVKLEADCNAAELFMKQRKVDKALAICQQSSALQVSGYFDNVLHSTELISRLKLCESMSLFSVQQNTLQHKRGTGEVTVSEPSLGVSAPSFGVVSDARAVAVNQDSSHSAKPSDLKIGMKNKTKERVGLKTRKVSFDSETESVSSETNVQESKTFPKTPSRVVQIKEGFSTPFNSARKTEKSKFSKMQTPASVSKHSRLLHFVLEDSDEEPVPCTKSERKPKTNKAATDKTTTVARKTGRRQQTELCKTEDSGTMQNLSARFQAEEESEKMPSLSESSDPCCSDRDLEQTVASVGENHANRKFFKTRPGVTSRKEVDSTNDLVTEKEDTHVFEFDEVDSPRTVGKVKKGRGRKAVKSVAMEKPKQHGRQLHKNKLDTTDPPVTVACQGSEQKDAGNSAVKPSPSDTSSCSISARLGEVVDEPSEAENSENRTRKEKAASQTKPTAKRSQVPKRVSRRGKDNSVTEPDTGAGNQMADSTDIAASQTNKPGTRGRGRRKQVTQRKPSPDKEPDSATSVTREVTSRLKPRRNCVVLTEISDNEAVEVSTQATKGRAVRGTGRGRRRKGEELETMRSVPAGQVKICADIRSCDDGIDLDLDPDTDCELGQLGNASSSPLGLFDCISGSPSPQPIRDFVICDVPLKPIRGLGLHVDAHISRPSRSSVISIGSIMSSLSTAGQDIRTGMKSSAVCSEEDDIEILRADTESSGKAARGGKEKGKQSTRRGNRGTASKQDNETQAPGSLEVSRSSGAPSLADITNKMKSMAELDVSLGSPSLGLQGFSPPDQSAIIRGLEASYQQLRRFPPCPRYSDICQMLALLHFDTDQQRAAFLLSEAMGVTFRHKYLINVGQKLRRMKKDEQLNGDAGEPGTGGEMEGGEPDVSSESLGHCDTKLLFNTDETTLQNMTDALPKDWTVYQVSVVHCGDNLPQMILTRFVGTDTPVMIKLAGFSTSQGQSLLGSFSDTLAASNSVMSIEDRAEWWYKRTLLDCELQKVILGMSTVWLAEWGGALKPRELLKDLQLEDTVKTLKKITKVDITLATLEVLVLCAADQLEGKKSGNQSVSRGSLHQCVSQLLGTSLAAACLDPVVSVIQELASQVPKDVQSDAHVVLILDKHVQQLPWECLPQLCGRSVSRMPSLSYLNIQLNYLQSQESSVFNKGVNYSNAFYMLDLDGDLPHTQAIFKDWFESEPGWTGIVGKPPTAADFSEAISSRDLFIYCGHGCGGRYYHGDDLRQLQGHAAALMMGCSSGKLKVKGQLEPSGMVINYFLSGCPCVVGNLWDVTDKDIDRFLEKLLKTWGSSSKTLSLPGAVADARSACKLKHLIGAAPVVYGLPVTVRR